MELKKKQKELKPRIHFVKLQEQNAHLFTVMKTDV